MSKTVHRKSTPCLALATILASITVLAFGLGTNVSAQTVGTTAPANTGQTTTSTDTTNVSVGTDGMQVAIDSKTGAFRAPTPEEAKILFEGMQKLLNRSTDGLTVTRYSDGSESVNLDDRFMDLSVAKVNPNGTISTECVTTPEEAAAFLGIKPKAKDPALLNNAPQNIAATDTTLSPKSVAKTKHSKKTHRAHK